jgi:hypothetical protein
MSKDETRFFPGEQFETKPKIDARKSSFGKISRLLQNSGTAWPTSYPGQPFLAFDCLPDSTAPAQLRALGYDPVCEGTGERILACGLTERFVRGATGELEPLIEGSTKPVAETRHHAGITRVRRFVFDL